MNTSSHLRMGNAVYHYLRRQCGVRLNRSAFLLGNVKPDFAVSLVTRPHYMCNYIDRIEQEILALSLCGAHTGAEFSRRLGVVCHFYADFFCHAHSDAFVGGLASHVAYERRLDRCFRDNRDALYQLACGLQPEHVATGHAVNRRTALLHERYDTTRHNCATDILYAMAACMSAARGVTTVARRATVAMRMR